MPAKRKAKRLPPLTTLVDKVLTLATDLYHNAPPAGCSMTEATRSQLWQQADELANEANRIQRKLYPTPRK